MRILPFKLVVVAKKKCGVRQLINLPHTALVSTKL
jgi:hypothetical protein